jgi:hypothetical protein
MHKVLFQLPQNYQPTNKTFRKLVKPFDATYILIYKHLYDVPCHVIMKTELCICRGIKLIFIVILLLLRQTGSLMSKYIPTPFLSLFFCIFSYTYMLNRLIFISESDGRRRKYELNYCYAFSTQIMLFFSRNYLGRILCTKNGNPITHLKVITYVFYAISALVTGMMKRKKVTLRQSPRCECDLLGNRIQFN